MKIFGWEKLEMLNIIEIVKLIVKGIKLFGLFLKTNFLIWNQKDKQRGLNSFIIRKE